MARGTERPESAPLREALCGLRFEQARWLVETGSTNDDLVAAARAGEGEQVLVTDLQTAGRGRRNRLWNAPAQSSVLMSLLVRDVNPPEAFWVVGAVALGAVEAAAEVAEVECNLKWPNDLMIDEQKCAGVLAQVVDNAAVIGIGINVNWPAELSAIIAGGDRALSPTALNHHRLHQAAVDRLALAIAIVTAASKWLEADREALRREWIRRCSTIGRAVRLDLANESIVGRAVDIAENGALIIERGGRRTPYEAGDVIHLRGPN